MFKLVIADDEGKQTVVPLVRDEVTIGRKEGNTIRLTERNVSRRHARLVKSNGAFVIEDLQSYNGVRVNGQRIGAETKLDAGDAITIGDYQLALQMEAVESAAKAKAAAVANADTAMIQAPGPPARLVMVTPPAPGAEYALNGDRTRIGRAEDLDIWVNHRSISREHAEIQKEPDGGLRLIDLGSANGVRVNNSDVQNALLEAGDVVELGQVRFRFVAAGEHYAFDADRTVQMDAVSIDPPQSNKKFMLVAIAIVLMAVIGALVVAFVGDDDETTATPLAVDNPGDNRPDDRYRAALTACETALDGGDVATALTHALTALEVRPNDQAALQCQARAQAAQTQEATFRRGVAHLDRGELEEAYFEFDNLPADSPLRQRGEVRQAVRSYGSFKLQAGNAALDDDPAEALRLAEFVLAMHGLTPEQQAQAGVLQRDAQARGATEAPPEVAAPTPVAPRSPQGGRRGRRGQPRTNPTPPTPEPDPPETSVRTPRPPPTDNSDEVRACVMRGDNACVVRLLEGHARNAQELAYLIEAYRARSQQTQAIRHMRTYVQRYPGTSRTNNYRQILARQR
ncbi:MAG: FHA domain-containing protein [Sandaracinaceae bacterium]